MGTRFERITESPDALAAVLASIPTADAPWDIAFEQAFCANCTLENCDDCPHKNVDRIKWWLGQKVLEMGIFETALWNCSSITEAVLRPDRKRREDGET